MPEQPDAYESAFDPREYLRNYYSGAVTDDERLILFNAAQWVRRGGVIV